MQLNLNETTTVSLFDIAANRYVSNVLRRNEIADEFRQIALSNWVWNMNFAAVSFRLQCKTTSHLITYNSFQKTFDGSNSFLNCAKYSREFSSLESLICRAIKSQDELSDKYVFALGESIRRTTAEAVFFLKSSFVKGEIRAVEF